MILRILAVLATVVVPALGLVLGGDTGAVLPGWALPSLAAVLVFSLLLARPRALLSLVIAAGLAALSAVTVVEAAGLLRVTADADDWPRYDLTQAPLPDGARGYVVVDGYLRNEWTLDEYRVEGGDRPDQNQDAAAELVPMLGTQGSVIAPDQSGAVVIARIPKGPARAEGLSSARGQLQPLPEGILDSLVTFDPKLSKEDVTGVLLDTTQIPTRPQAWTQVGIALVAALLALALAWLALADPVAEGDEPRT